MNCIYTLPSKINKDVPSKLIMTNERLGSQALCLGKKIARPRPVHRPTKDKPSIKAFVSPTISNKYKYLKKNELLLHL